MIFNARQEALAFRIYIHCTPLGWDCTHMDVANALGVSWQRVVGVCRSKGWAHRLRVSRRDYDLRFK